MAQYINANILGVTIPDRVLRRLVAAGDGAPEEGIAIALEVIAAPRSRQGVHGVNLMLVRREEVLPRIIRAPQPALTQRDERHRLPRFAIPHLK